MSPIIYQPHECETPVPQPVARPMAQGTLWQCETCGAIHMARDARNGEWCQIMDPRREHRIAEAIRQQASTPKPTAPTVTPEMVQLANKTLDAHEECDLRDGVFCCAECGVAIRPELTLAAHSLNAAAAALQGALAAGEQR